MSRAEMPVRRLATWAGLTVGPVLWAANMQAGQLLPYVDCRSGIRSNLVITLLALVFTLAAGLAAWRTPLSGQTGVFLARLGALLSLVFGFALLLQAAAGLLLSGCER